MANNYVQDALHCVTWGIHTKALTRSKHSNILFLVPYQNELKSYVNTETFTFIIITQTQKHQNAFSRQNGKWWYIQTRRDLADHGKA